MEQKSIAFFSNETPSISIRGLGILFVKGSILVPNPAAKIIAEIFDLPRKDIYNIWINKN